MRDLCSLSDQLKSERVDIVKLAITRETFCKDLAALNDDTFCQVVKDCIIFFLKLVRFVVRLDEFSPLTAQKVEHN